MIRRSPMGTIYRPSYSGSGGTEATAFIQCINGREPQIHELWCLCLDRICRKVHSTAYVEVPAGTIRYFVTDYIAKNGRQIPIIGQLSVNGSVQFLGLTDQAWGSGFPFITNLLARVESTGWGSPNNYNQNWGGQLNDANRIKNVTWGDSVSACPAYLPWSPTNPCAAPHRIRDDFFRYRRQERLWR